ncbi:hypothetical protein HOK76_02520, partial [archaeon]|nr:hypothetical protein [archaeon]
SLCDQILINKLKIKWFINTIPNINYNLNFFKKIRFCGCFGIHLDIISFSDSLLRFNKCSFNSIDIKNNLRDAKNGGLNTSISFTLGKNETKNDIDLCLSEINDNSLYIDDLGRIRIKNKTSKTIKFRSQILNTAKKNNIFILN